MYKDYYQTSLNLAVKEGCMWVQKYVGICKTFSHVPMPFHKATHLFKHLQWCDMTFVSPPWISLHHEYLSWAGYWCHSLDTYSSLWRCGWSYNPVWKISHPLRWTPSHTDVPNLVHRCTKFWGMTTKVKLKKLHQIYWVCLRLNIDIFELVGKLCAPFFNIFLVLLTFSALLGHFVDLLF